MSGTRTIHRRVGVVDTSGCICADVECVGCRYNLRTISIDARCPECDEAVKSTIADWLGFAHPQWVGTLVSGTNWIAASIPVWLGVIVVTGLAARFVDWTDPAHPARLTDLIGLLVVFVGPWKLTAADQDRLVPEKPLSARRVARIGITSTFVLLLMQLWLFPFLQVAITYYWNVILSTVASAVQWLGFALLCVYARALAMRVPNISLMKQTRVLIWITVLALALVITVKAVDETTWWLRTSTTPLTAPLVVAAQQKQLRRISNYISTPAHMCLWLSLGAALLLNLRYRRSFIEARDRALKELSGEEGVGA